MNTADKLDLCEISGGLPDELKNLDIELFEEIDSTNSYIRRQIGDSLCKPRGLVVANRQTAGRGRSGHTFYSPENTGIYMSYYYTPADGLENAHLITTRAAVAVVRALEALYNDTFNIKWVNDIYYKGHKIAGILTEAIPSGINRGIVIVGIGINVTTAEFPEEISDLAGALPFREGVFRNAIISAITSELYKMTLLPADDRSYFDEFDSRMLLKGEVVSYIDKENTRTARIVGITGDFALIVEDASGSRTVLDSGEVREIRNIRE